MKKLTVQLAGAEIKRVARARLINGPMDQDANTRIGQFVDAVDEAITQLQTQVQQLQQELAALKK